MLWPQGDFVSARILLRTDGRRPVRRSTILTVALGLATGSVAALAGVIVTTSHDTDQAKSASHTTPVAAVAHVGDPNDPATWTLPVQAYMPTSHQARTVMGSRDELMKACMTKAGFSHWRPSPDLPTLGGTNDMDARYGINDLAQARQFGYHPDSRAQKQYDDAINADIAGRASVDQRALLDCAGKANQAAPAVQTPQLIDRIDGNSWKQAQREPAVKKAFAGWSACMDAKGYHYAKPMDANDDGMWWKSDAATAREKAVAVADVRCRDEYHVERVWFDTEASLQQRAIRQHAATLETLREDMQAAVNRAARAAR
jgi:hypothetical protein